MDDNEQDQVFPLPWWAVLLLTAMFWPSAARSEPRLAVEAGGIRIVVHSEDCAFKKVVTNLPKRATWTEKGQTYEGCAGLDPDLRIVMFYFSTDKTMTVLPADVLVPVTGI